MNNMQGAFLFPFQDRESWNQFLIACAVMFAAFFIPVLPMVLLTGYTMKIMRQIIEEKQAPTMPLWQGSDWSEMLMDGLRLYGARLVLMSPLFIFLVGGILLIVSGSIGFAALAEDGPGTLAPIGGVFLFAGISLLTLFVLLSVPVGIVSAAAQAHVAARRSFTAAFEFREWWHIFRRGIAQFVIAYVIILVASFVFSLILQLAMMTLVLICIVPFLMIPYSAYLVIVTNTLYAQAYAAGQAGLQPA